MTFVAFPALFSSSENAHDNAYPDLRAALRIGGGTVI